MNIAIPSPATPPARVHPHTSRSWPAPLLCLCLALPACTTNPQFSGTPMPLKDALLSVGDALQAADRKADGRKGTGLVPAEVTVGFNVTNASKDSTGVELSVVPVPSTTIGANWKGEVTSQTGSTISVKYSSILLAPASSIAGSKTPEELAKLLEQLRRDNVTLKNMVEVQGAQLKAQTKKLDDVQKSLPPAPP